MVKWIAQFSDHASFKEVFFETEEDTGFIEALLDANEALIEQQGIFFAPLLVDRFMPDIDNFAGTTMRFISQRDSRVKIYLTREESAGTLQPNLQRYEMNPGWN